MIITIHDRDQAEEEALAKAVTLALRWHTASNADVYVEPRTPSGWLEYGVVIKYPGGGIYIALIQREPGAPFESHS